MVMLNPNERVPVYNFTPAEQKLIDEIAQKGEVTEADKGRMREALNAKPAHYVHAAILAAERMAAGAELIADGAAAPRTLEGLELPAGRKPGR